MSAPTTTEEIKTELLESAYHGYGFLAHLIQQWRAEWLRDAEPRRRPTSEVPDVGDLIVQLAPKGCLGMASRWCGGEFITPCTGWILLERAKTRTIAEEARDLAAEDPGVRGSEFWMARATELLRRFAEEKGDV